MAANVWDLALNGQTEKLEESLNESPRLAMAADKYGQTPLHVACTLGNFATVKMILQRVNDVNVKDFDGNSPLHYCCSGGHVEIVQYLLSIRSADPLVRNNEGQTTLHKACDGSKYDWKEKCLEIALLLLQTGLNPYDKDFRGNIPADYCVDSVFKARYLEATFELRDVQRRAYEQLLREAEIAKFAAEQRAELAEVKLEDVSCRLALYETELRSADHRAQVADAAKDREQQLSATLNHKLTTAERQLNSQQIQISELETMLKGMTSQLHLLEKERCDTRNFEVQLALVKDELLNESAKQKAELDSEISNLQRALRVAEHELQTKEAERLVSMHSAMLAQTDYTTTNKKLKDVERVLAEKERNFSLVEARALLAEQRIESFENQLRLGERARVNDTSLENELARLRSIIDEKKVTNSILELKNKDVESRLKELEDNFSRRIADYEGMLERQQNARQETEQVISKSRENVARDMKFLEQARLAAEVRALKAEEGWRSALLKLENFDNVLKQRDEDRMLTEQRARFAQTTLGKELEKLQNQFAESRQVLSGSSHSSTPPFTPEVHRSGNPKSDIYYRSSPTYLSPSSLSTR